MHGKNLTRKIDKLLHGPESNNYLSTVFISEALEINGREKALQEAILYICNVVCTRTHSTHKKNHIINTVIKNLLTNQFL